ncbi:LPS export ABC transporter permease LptF [Varunaivibrio sulfuroxidans]|uniref:Lipopolysaccharide export system permease protein n=1 Tax=Varunaivibrio sulfuroxidans TaxID=1773489 RepID=A0A4R3J4K2_9PROT|nr:LPS export ABC transporter permease LptF [Varunaivibrio sulfuroxidans]TCS60114.1 lipopolysaccharide export system permease protein [Varunaivibrio sulfuroxidans]WES30912.1 LPS export ABC transporter permease LptF [Varunaivibrio sulfuroxidans]
MKRLTWYMLGQLVVGMALVSFSLTAVIWLTQSLRFVDMIVNRGLSGSTFLYLTLLLTPNFLTEILPISLFAVTMFVYNRMVMDRELVVMSAAGLSRLSLAKPALLLAVLTALAGYALNLWIVPATYGEFRQLQWDIRYSFSHLLLQEGQFNNISNGVTVYVRERTADGQLLGILAQDSRNPDKVYTLMAERGAMVNSKEGARVVMYNGNRQDIDSKTKRLSILYFDRYIFDLGLTGKAPGQRNREARERTVPELLNIRKDPHISDYGKYLVEAHKRLTAPLNAIGFTLIALISVLSGNFTRRMQSRRVIIGVGVTLALQIGVLGLYNVAGKNLMFVPLIYASAILPIIVGFILLSVTPRRRRRDAPSSRHTRSMHI